VGAFFRVRIETTKTTNNKTNGNSKTERKSRRKKAKKIVVSRQEHPISRSPDPFLGVDSRLIFFLKSIGTVPAA
jgi:hypothetical protein